MMSLALIQANEFICDDVMAYRKAFIEEGRNVIEGAVGLKECACCEEWFAFLKQNANEESVTQGFVPATTWFAYDQDVLVGIINVRHRLNDYLYHYGGHIGYSVHPSQRGKGYGKAMLHQILPYCKNLGINAVLLVCRHDNEASKRVILGNKGIFENEVMHQGELLQRYWITQ